MKVGIYLPGLGQSYTQESLVKYASRFMHEMDVNHANRHLKFSLKPEKVVFLNDKEVNVISIIEKDGTKETQVYKFYEFNYSAYLVEQFSRYNIFVKSFLLLTLVLKKLPRLFLNIFKSSPYKRGLESLYVFSLFLMIASSIFFLVPTALEVFFKFLGSDEFQRVVQSDAFKSYIRPGINKIGLKREMVEAFSKDFVSLTAIILVLVPKAKVLITDLATEFVCTHNYLDNGQQAQKILGMLDQLVEFISEREPAGTKIHYHAYSFGSVIAIDHLYPYGNLQAESIKKMAEGLVTIGTPFEFINAYYPKYFGERDAGLDPHLTWINVFSLADALASNFRLDNLNGEAEYGIVPGGVKPININYEITKPRSLSVIDFFFLYSLRAHGIYWDADVKGQSCMRGVYYAFKNSKIMIHDLDPKQPAMADPLQVDVTTKKLLGITSP
jgi:hypothetical protein